MENLLFLITGILIGFFLDYNRLRKSGKIAQQKINKTLEKLPKRKFTTSDIEFKG